jgi:hypothetical protein
MRERAETRMREIEKDTEKIRKRRSELLDDIRARASRLGELANAATAMPAGDAMKPDAETLKLEPGKEPESPVATEEPSPPPGTNEPHEATGKLHDQTPRADTAGPNS